MGAGARTHLQLSASIKRPQSGRHGSSSRYPESSTLPAYHAVSVNPTRFELTSLSSSLSVARSPCFRLPGDPGCIVPCQFRRWDARKSRKRVGFGPVRGPRKFGQKNTKQTGVVGGDEEIHRIRGLEGLVDPSPKIEKDKAKNTF